MLEALLASPDLYPDQHIWQVTGWRALGSRVRRTELRCSRSFLGHARAEGHSWGRVRVDRELVGSNKPVVTTGMMEWWREQVESASRSVFAVTLWTFPKTYLNYEAPNLSLYRSTRSGTHSTPGIQFPSQRVIDVIDIVRRPQHLEQTYRKFLILHVTLLH